MDRDSELGPVSPACSGVGVGEKCCAVQQHAAALGNPNSHSCAALCQVPGQGTPVYSWGQIGPTSLQLPGGSGLRVCFAAQQDVANPGLYFLSCDSLSFVLPNTTTLGRLLVQSANNALLCSLLLGVLSVMLQVGMI